MKTILKNLMILAAILTFTSVSSSIAKADGGEYVFEGDYWGQSGYVVVSQDQDLNDQDLYSPGDQFHDQFIGQFECGGISGGPYDSTDYYSDSNYSENDSSVAPDVKFTKQ